MQNRGSELRKWYIGRHFTENDVLPGEAGGDGDGRLATLGPQVPVEAVPRRHIIVSAYHIYPFNPTSHLLPLYIMKVAAILLAALAAAGVDAKFHR